jgi:hypothetical protein
MRSGVSVCLLATGAVATLTGSAVAQAQVRFNAGPAKAVDGRYTDIYFDKWCARSVGPAALRVDLAAPYQLDTFVVRHAGSAGEHPMFNTGDYVIRVSRDGLFWIPVVSVVGNTANITTSVVPGVIGWYCRARAHATDAVHRPRDPNLRVRGYRVPGKPVRARPVLT